MAKKIEPIEIEPIVIPDNCFEAKGFFNTVKGAVKPGDIVDIADLIGTYSDLIKLGLA